MKRHLILCIALVAVMASCVKEPRIYRILSDEEAAVVPYQMEQTAKFLNENGDTLCFTVVHDTTFVTEYYDQIYFPEAKMKYYPQPYFYMRQVVMQGRPQNSYLLRFSVAPDKVVTVIWHSFGRTLSLNDLPTTTFTIGETTYENVHIDQGSYMADTAMISYAWYYSEQFGLLAAKHGEYSLTLIP